MPFEGESRTYDPNWGSGDPHLKQKARLGEKRVRHRTIRKNLITGDYIKR